MDSDVFDTYRRIVRHAGNQMIGVRIHGVNFYTENVGKMEAGVKLIQDWKYHPDVNHFPSKNMYRSFVEAYFEESIEGQYHTQGNNTIETP